MSSIPSALLAASAAIVLLLGLAHLLYTFVGPKLLPRDRELQVRMQEVSPVITRQTTMWKAWIGFNASHSLGAMLFSLVYLMLAARHMDVLRQSPTFVWLAGIASAAYVVLALRYWFRIPLAATAIATSCFVAGALTMSLGY